MSVAEKAEKAVDVLTEQMQELLSFVKTETKEQLPQYCKELMRYNVVSGWALAAGFFVVAVITTLLAIHLNNVDHAEYLAYLNKMAEPNMLSRFAYSDVPKAETGAMTMISVAVAGALWIITTFAIIIATMTTMKVKMAPRVYIVDHIQSKLKGGN